VCRDFGVSRKTGYKIFDRYKEHGLEALSDRSRRPVRYANQLPQPIESLIVRLKGEKPHWGARAVSGRFRYSLRSAFRFAFVRCHGSTRACSMASSSSSRDRPPCSMTCFRRSMWL
jgi:hypothetical protein